MGYYDGLGLTSTRASTYELAQKTVSPVVLVVNARGAALSVLASVRGFLDFLPDDRICGVILNGCTAMTYAPLARVLEDRLGVKACGFLPNLPDCALKSRHLGLVTAAEVADLREKMQRLAAEASRRSIWTRADHRARSAAAGRCAADASGARQHGAHRYCGRDNAFCFYYEDSLGLLRTVGAELVPFSPLSDSALPAGLDGLYLGGGYPELYAAQLSENRSMCSSVRAALEAGLPCIAECGGFMYLTEAIGEHPMVGFLPGRCFDAGKLARFGYVTLTAERDNLLCRAGGSIPAHEFHHWDAEQTGDAFTAAKPFGRSWPCVFATDTLYAGYPHFHFYANPSFAVRFLDACRKGKHHAGTDQTDGH